MVDVERRHAELDRRSGGHVDDGEKSRSQEASVGPGPSVSDHALFADRVDHAVGRARFDGIGEASECQNQKQHKEDRQADEELQPQAIDSV